MNKYVSTPRKAMKVFIRSEPESWSRTGVAWRAFEPDGTPLYIGAETEKELREKVLIEYPRARIQTKPRSRR